MDESPIESVDPMDPSVVSNIASASGSSVESLFHRRIEFHPARKPFSSALSSRDFHLETLNPGSTSQRPAMGAGAMVAAVAQGKRSDCGEFFEHGFDPELSLRITFRRIGAGLANLGNTCFLNSVLQCLTYTEPFAAYLQSGKHKTLCHTAGFCAMCALQSHVMNALQSSGKILSPLNLVKNLRCISRNFRNSRQEDAHEYMVNLLESMHKCCLPSGVPSESASAYEKSLVHKIFGGRLRSQVKCMQCSYCSNKFDPFLDLSLEITKADSLNKALRHFTAVEQLDDGQKHYQCQRCKQKVRALKQLTIDKAPYVLTIHLKRFGSDVPGQKIDKNVEFGPTLDFTPFMSDPHEHLKYTLYGVLVHAGWSTHSGHYYCFVRTSSGMWHSLDDNQVFQVSEKTVLSQKAYMLFYARERSSATKQPLSVVHKLNTTENICGHKMVPHMARGIYDVIQNTHLKEASLQKKSDNALREVSVVQTQTCIKLKEASVLQSNGDNLVKELQQTPALTDSVKLFVSPGTSSQSVIEEFKHSSESKVTPVPTQSLMNGSSSTCGSLQISNGDHPFEAASVKVEFCMNSRLPNLSTVNCFEKVVAEGFENENVGNTNGNIQNIKTPGKKNTENVSAGSGCVVNRHPDSNGCVQKDTSRTAVMEDQDISHKNKDPLDDLPGKKEETENLLVKDESADITGKEQSLCQTDLKPRKLAKVLIAGGICPGRKQLFLSYLSFQTSKKHKKNEKRHWKSRKSTSQKAKEKSIAENDDVTSTSESLKNDYANSLCSSRKRSHAHLVMKNTSQGLNDVRCSTFNLMNTMDSSKDNRGQNDMLSTYEQSKSSLNSAASGLDARETNANSRSSDKNAFMSLLTRGLKETTVARWDDVDSPDFELNGDARDAGTNSIGYVLDEWDEDYDRGKRKKLKKFKRSFGGPNLFQEAANMKAQQKKKMKVDRTSSANKPFRI